MGIAKQDRLRDGRAVGFWLTTSLLFLLAVIMRWWRLDLMSFNYDQAAICERAMELFGGRIPFTGIVNSLGFRNAPGYVWSLLPAFSVSCSPLIATAWHGLLCASMVVPLALIGQRFRSDYAAYLPAVLAAFLPAEILAGRNLWAQYLVTPLAAWALWALVCTLDSSLTLGRRQWYGAAALGLLAWAVSVHYGAGIVLVIAAAALWRLFRQSQRRGKGILLLPAALVCLTVLPSFADFMHRLSNPLPKPDYVLQYEARLPDPLPFWVRVTDAASASLLNSTLAVPVLDVSLPGESRWWVRGYDVVIALLLVAGLVFCLRKMLSQKSPDRDDQKTVAALVLIWITLPALIAGIFLDWVQPSYFAASLPAGWLMLLYLPEVSAERRIMQVLPYAVAGIIAVGGAGVTLKFNQVVAASDVVAANYYIPYHLQTRIADSIRSEDVSGDRVWHLSTPTFDTVYGYLVDCGVTEKSSGSAEKYVVMEDRFYVEKYPNRLAFLLESEAEQVGPELVKTFPSRGAAEIFRQKYYDIAD